MPPSEPLPASEPLLDRAPGDILFHRPSGPVTAAAFLADVAALAAALPPGRHPVNLCRDRYAFAVAFAAAVLAGRTTLLNVDIAALPALARDYEGCFPLADADVFGHPPAPGVAPGIDSAHLAAIVFTSGSTGAPVPHPKPWGALAARSRAAADQFGIAGGTVVGMVPPQHMYGFETTILLPLHAPVASWCGPAFFPGDVAAALIASPAPRRLVTTPLQLRTLLQARLPLPPVEACISATAPLDPALAAEIEAAWHAPVLEIFGATECGSIASRRTTAGPAWSTYPGLRLAIAPEGATVHAPGAAPVPLADLLEPEGDGFRLLGRRTDVVKLGGRRASLPGLNRLLIGLPGVDDGAFVLPDDEAAASRLVAVVVAPGRSAPAILADLRRVMDPIFLPRRVIRVEALPRNALGKLPRQALLQLLAASG